MPAKGKTAVSCVICTVAETARFCTVLFFMRGFQKDIETACEALCAVIIICRNGRKENFL